MAFSFRNLIDANGELADQGQMRQPNVGQLNPQVSTTAATAPTAGGGQYAGVDVRQLLEQYQARVPAGSQDSIDRLVAAMRADGIPIEQRGDLVRFPGADAGWIDVRQDKAQVEGRRGWDQASWAYQPFYGSEDFDRLVAEGRNPHTGEQALPGQVFSRDQDAPISGPGASYGGMPPGYFTTGVNNLASFQAPGINAPFTQQFKPPTGTDDPGFQFALDKGMKALERSAAAKGTLLTGGHMQDLQENAIGLALQGYDKAWGREFDVYNMNRGTFWGNQQNAFNRLNSAAGLGQNSAAQYANNASDIAIGQGNVNAAAQVAGSNATNAGITNAVNTGLSVWDQIRNRRQPSGMGTMAPADARY